MDSTAQKTDLKAIPANVNEIKLQPTSLDIWENKYCLKSKQGERIDENIDQTYQRVAKALVEVEPKEIRQDWYEKFLWALRQGVIPAGRITSNAGAQAHKPATSTINCTVSGIISDSMEDILQKNLEAGLTLKAGCGIGYEFSTLRPKALMCRVPAPTPQGRYPLWIFMTKPVSPCHLPEGDVGRKWRPSKSVTPMLWISSKPNERTVDSVNSIYRS